MSGNALPLPFPYLPGDQNPDSFEDKAQQNFDRLAIKVGEISQRLFFGTGTPEGAVTASVGALYSRLDGGASTTLYVKESGAGATGWVAK